ncbi:cell adhesion molecule Dscam1-like isoform X2 [Brevipalpus obovatus]|uniref:cell adhesion molecule Dscam1-like isoform X2 n=1 Tax=Brevipalpus obovatus TaxID=246614 RepID=UPI003D9F1E41
MKSCLPSKCFLTFITLSLNIFILCSSPVLLFAQFTPIISSSSISSSLDSWKSYLSKSSSRISKNSTANVYNSGFTYGYEINVYDEYVLIGNTAVFKCHFPSLIRDHLQVTSWIQDNGRIIENSNQLKPGARIFSLNGYLLVVDVTHGDNSRSFKCQVHNSITKELKTSKTSGKLITLDAASPVRPNIASLQQTLRSFNGNTVNLFCIGHGYPAPKYYWFKRKSVSFTGPSSSTSPASMEMISVQNELPRIAILPGTGILIVKNVTQTDSGHYDCVANNSAGEDRKTFELIIKQPLAVSLQSTARTNRIETGDEVSLTCNVIGYPLKSIVWTKDGKPLNMTTGHRRKVLSSSRVLNILKVEREDQGCYRCTAHGDSEDIASDELCLSLLKVARGENGKGLHQIDSAQDPPILREVFRESVRNPGESLSLKCVASGNPLPTVTWTLDNFPIPEAHRIQYGDYVSIHGDVVSYVNITSLRLEDGGLYRCEAVNDAGMAHHTQMVHIKGKPYIRPMSNITVLAGQQVSIRCPASGFPLSRITWFKGSKELPTSDRHRIENNGTLLISEARREVDEGKYVCQAMNNRDQIAKRDVHLQVLKKPNISPFTFLSHITEGMRFMIPCNVVTGDPPISIEWVKDNQSLNVASLDILIQDTSDVGSSLVFHDVKQKHAGNYTCIARNRVGQDSFTAPMVVKVPPKWTIEPMDQSVVIGDRVTFDCQAEGYPMPLIRWKMASEGKSDFRSISSNYHIQTLENGSLVIRETLESDSGHFSCEAENGVGSVLSKMVRLSVHVQAHFKSNFQVIRIRKGNPMNISCEAFGEKPIYLKWLKDRIEIDALTNRRYSISERDTEGGLLSFLLSSAATRQDSGAFICISSNAYGQSEMETRVLIEEVPDPPSEVVAYEFASKSVTLRYSLSYSGNSAVLNYLIQWKKDKDSWSSSLSKEVDGSTSHTVVTDLIPLTTYDFRVFAINALGKSEPSKVISITTDEEAPSSPPILSRVDALSSTSMQIRWKAPKHIESFGSITGYYVGYKELNSDKPLTFKTIENKLLDKLQFVINNLKKSSPYVFVVQAFNSKGTSPPSNEVQARTLDKDPPSTPSLRIVKVTKNSVRVTWSLPIDSESPTGYRILLRPNSYDLKAHETINDGKASAHTITSLRCGSKYQVYLIAFNEIGESGPSEALSFQTEGDVPDPPDKSSFIHVNTSFIMLHLSAWHASCPINNFEIKYKEHGHTEWTLVSSTVTPILDVFLVTGLQPATWYKLMINAYSDPGNKEAQYNFATLTENGATIAPMSVSSNPESYRLRRYVQMVLPITCVFISIVVVIVFLLFFGFKRNRIIGNPANMGDHLSVKGDNISMSSTKVVYESAHRDERNSVYCQSPYATTRVSLYFQENPALNANSSAMNHSENSYDMPLLKSHATNRALYQDFSGGMSLCDNANQVDISGQPIFSR